ncbi:EKC/KEOPS complex subunit LAGE3-like [Apodemus sylvaticus]|uniref:EKC/KEOPS complex subunit LAGE3-like n=1 Tax=Apodemus sylvaticus TaxID=10129 RepID=UPI0022431DB9|nr:EKC/KEOPS complex subunit LAGE3-like [Apodemus sylvaticus]XP_052027844.1 EKC/KEOPS complex subunit LAGE3-like [Apodemus sylvaticus]XP_052027845.1 EKC/KEOPS complex subunit LAGE3-like [Apodemus sylvaticus]
MQDPGEDNAGGLTGIDDGGEDGQHRPQAAEAQASSQSLVTEGDHDNSSPETGPQDAGRQAAPGSSRPGSPVVSGVSAEEAALVPQDEQAPLLPGPSGDAAATASRLLEFSVRVPFSSAVEAAMARRSLVANAQRQLLMVPQEFTVNDSILAVRWTTEDPVLFRISINNFLDQLSLVMRNIQHLQFVAFKRRRERSHNN